MRQYQIMLVVFLALTSVTGAAEIYRWVDENGQVHFGDKPGGTDHEVIEHTEEDFSTIGTPSETENLRDPAVTEQPQSDQSGPVQEQGVDQVENDSSETLSEHEKARRQRVEELEALAEELREAREKREGKREKERAELEALREGCAKAEEEIVLLQKKINHYISSQTNRGSQRRPEEVVLDSRRQRMLAELEAKQEFVQSNCDNL
ncbi:MAG: DUF4124 domain-containing protein [Thioalkalispiraceae bacterium]